MSEKKGISRLVSLLIRSLKDVEIFFSAFAFAFKYSSKNKITDLFQFRKAIEIEQVSPFRSMVKNFRAGKSVNLQLPQFGNAKIEFHLDDYFQMAICEEFIKYKIYDLSLLKFTPDVSIDCGTYRGYFSFLIHEQFKNCKIVCIEPHPENYKSLMKSVSENSIENVVAFNNALSTKQGSIELELWGSNMSKNDANQNSPNLVSVATIDLFEILKSMKQSEKLMLKMENL